MTLVCNYAAMNSINFASVAGIAKMFAFMNYGAGMEMNRVDLKIIIIEADCDR